MWQFLAIDIVIPLLIGGNVTDYIVQTMYMTIIMLICDVIRINMITPTHSHFIKGGFWFCLISCWKLNRLLLLNLIFMSSFCLKSIFRHFLGFSPISSTTPILSPQQIYLHKIPIQLMIALCFILSQMYSWLAPIKIH